MSSLIDTHTHLETFARNGELTAVLQRARDAGVEALVTVGTDAGDWPLYREIASAQAGFVHYAVGLHPCDVDADWEQAIAQSEGYWRPASSASSRPVALGEIGLDRFHLPKGDAAAAERIFGLQREAFAVQLQIARRLGCPVVVHSRAAFRECVETIDASGVDWGRIVFHCFSEGPAEMAELTGRGGFGSFTGVVTYKNAETVRAAAKTQGLARLMIETDAPYLTPVPHRGKPNEPAYIGHTAEYCARLFGVSFDELAAVTTANARRFYGLAG